MSKMRRIRANARTLVTLPAISPSLVPTLCLLLGDWTVHPRTVQPWTVHPQTVHPRTVQPTLFNLRLFNLWTLQPFMLGQFNLWTLTQLYAGTVQPCILIFQVSYSTLGY